ncbi:MAG: ChaN family lipoprotein [Bacteroidetes bacterium]|nr:ChaN family lipoprotein [Bacteroidota bacterium]
MTHHQTNPNKMSFFKTILICSILIIGSQSFGQITEKNYKIYSTKANKEVPLNDILEDMKNNDVLFFGEGHNDSVAHYLEAKILEMFYQKFAGNTALSMEMFERDVQTVMNEYLQGSIREKNFTKDARVWSNYRDYKPMVEFAKSNKLDVICANAAARYSNLAVRKGLKGLMVLPNESKNNFAPLPYDTASGKYYEKLQTLFGSGPSHTSTPSVTDTIKKAPSMPPMPQMNLIMGQSLWDATMAYSISQYLAKNKNKKVLQVNGRFHSEEGFAAVTQLKKYRPKTKILIVTSISDDSFPNIDWNGLKNLGDYIIATDPTVPRTFKE